MSEAFNRASLQAIHDNRKRVDGPNPNDQPWANGVTPLEYAAIHLRVEHPDLSAWLNEMIRKARRDEFAKAALCGVAMRRDGTYRSDAQEALSLADAMLAEGDGE